MVDTWNEQHIFQIKEQQNKNLKRLPVLKNIALRKVTCLDIFEEQKLHSKKIDKYLKTEGTGLKRKINGSAT